MQQLFDIRLAMLASGYVIIPVIGKKPPLEGWQNVKSASREVLEAWERDYPVASNTGILTRFTPTFDIDLRNELAALAVENMVREHFNGRGTILTRIGFAPKRAIPFRTKEPFKKLDIRFIAPDGVKPDKLEFLGDGQHFVANGIHPETGGEYVWFGGDPTSVPYDKLPEISVEEAEQLRDKAVEMLVKDFGYVVAASSKKSSSTSAERAKSASRNSKRDYAWAQAALEAECALVANAAIGERNSQLNKSSFNLHQIIYGNPGLLTENEVRQRLFAAAEACGLVADDGEDAAWRTIESGAAGAETQPRTRPLSLMEQPASGTSSSGNGSTNGAMLDLVTASATASASASSNASPNAGPAPAPAARRQIILIEGDYHLAVDAAEEALLSVPWVDIYQRGGTLVRPIQEELAAADDRTTRAWRLVEVQPAYLLEMLSRVAIFEEYNKRARAWVKCNCPASIVQMLMARQGHWQVPILLSVVNTPPFRRNGTLAMTPGYDPDTRLIFNPDGVTFPPIPDHPTKEQALAALEILREPIKTFPFKSPVDEAVVLSMFLTALCRRVLDFAPLHGLSATAAGTGKSMLVDLVSILMSDREAPVISIGSSREELEKRAGASLLAGDAVITFDNCNSALGGDLVCQMLSQRWVRVRVLGLSRQVDAPTSSLITATGNNLTLEGDMTRRSVCAELDAGVERPELREFDVNPKDVFRQRRGELVSAALTILRAGRVANLAPISPPLGGFEMWSAWVRNTLQWLGCEDPCKSMEQLYQGDPLREEHETMIVIWRDHLNIGSEFHAQQLVERSLFNQELRDALLAVAQAQNSSGVISTKRLGRWLKRVDGKICQGLCIKRSRILAGHTMWRLISG